MKDLKTAFLEALVSNPRLSPGHNPEEFLGKIFPDPEMASDSPLFSLLSTSRQKAVSPFSFDIRGLDCFLLLHTKKGCGKLLLDNQVYTLASSSLLLLDCQERFRLDIAISPWDYQLFLLRGMQLPYYYSLQPDAGPVITAVLPYTELSMALERLAVIENTETLFAALTVSHLIETILTCALTDQLAGNTPPSDLPAYLTEMKELFDTDFVQDFSLNALESRFRISKYRLCREFHAAFGLPPLQYLNKRRIDIACHLLITTHFRVHEVGTQVGIDNTNHFISLFRKYTGFTPLEYRQRMFPH